MTQEDIDRIWSVFRKQKSVREELEQRSKELETELREACRGCDHRWPDGSSADEDQAPFGFSCCKICYLGPD